MTNDYPLLRKLQRSIKRGSAEYYLDPEDKKYLEPINAKFMEKSVIPFYRFGGAFPFVVREGDKDVIKFRNHVGTVFEENPHFPEDGHVGIVMSDVAHPYAYIKMGKEKMIFLDMDWLKNMFADIEEHLSDRMELRLFYEEYKKIHGEISLKNFMELTGMNKSGFDTYEILEEKFLKED